MTDPITSYNRVPPPSDPNSAPFHLDGELQRLEQHSASIISGLNALTTSTAADIAAEEAARIAADALKADITYVDTQDSTEASARAAAISALSSVYAVKAQTDFISGFMSYVVAGDYKLVVKAPIAMAIINTITICTTGTCTATFKINTTALGGTANSVSTTEDDQAHTTSNAVAAGDDIVMTLSSVSSCENLTFTIVYTKALD